MISLFSPHFKVTPRSLARYVIGASVGFVLFWTLKLYWDAGQFKSVQTEHMGLRCKVWKGFPGLEDLVQVPKTPLVLGAFQKRVLLNTEKHDAGLLWKKQGEEPQRVDAGLDEFRPHGVSFVPKTEHSGVFGVINHRQNGDTVELFRIGDSEDPNSFRHVHTILLPSIFTANSLLLNDEDDFYFTTDFGSHNAIVQNFEKYLRLPRGGLYRYKGGEVSKLVSGLFYGNGIERHNGKIYIAEMLSHQIRIFHENEAGGNLVPADTILLDAAPDNLRIDSSGSIYVGAHPKLLTLSKHSKDPKSNKSPSEIIRVEPLPNGTWKSQKMFLDDGLGFSAISTAIPQPNGGFLMGMIYDDGLVECSPKG
jgi:arylesterase / paraoxonase